MENIDVGTPSNPYNELKALLSDDSDLLGICLKKARAIWTSTECYRV
jgi:hypothetical protein